MRISGRKLGLTLQFIADASAAEVFQPFGLAVNSVGRHTGSVDQVLLPQPVRPD